MTCARPSPTAPLYFAAYTADLAVQQARKVPALIEQLRAEAPERFEAVRNTDPKVVQEKVTTQAKEAQATVQAKVTEVFGSLDAADLKKLGESAQDLALRSVGIAAEYAVRARETYEKVAVHGEQAVRTWRGETADEIVEIAAVVEAEPKAAPAPKSEPKPTAVKPAAAAKPATCGQGRSRRDEARARRGQGRARQEGSGPAQARREEDHAARREVNPAGLFGTYE